MPSPVLACLILLAGLAAWLWRGPARRRAIRETAGPGCTREGVRGELPPLVDRELFDGRCRREFHSARERARYLRSAAGPLQGAAVALAEGARLAELDEQLLTALVLLFDERGPVEPRELNARMRWAYEEEVEEALRDRDLPGHEILELLNATGRCRFSTSQLVDLALAGIVEMTGHPYCGWSYSLRPEARHWIAGVLLRRSVPAREDSPTSCPPPG